MREAGNSLCVSLQGELGRGVCYCGLKVDSFLLSLKRPSLDTGPKLALGQEESCGCEGSHGRSPGLFVFSTNVLACLQSGGFPLPLLLLIQPRPPVTNISSSCHWLLRLFFHSFTHSFNHFYFLVHSCIKWLNSCLDSEKTMTKKM